MNNIEINAVKEFKRFLNTYIYQDTVSLIIEEIKSRCRVNEISFEPLPQAIIKFNSKIYPDKLHDILRTIFIGYFNDQRIISLIRNKIHTEFNDDELKNLLRITFQEIQYGNPYYLVLMYNVNILNNNNVYLYL